MLIVCPSCTTAYRIELSTLGTSGRSVRCARCRHVWFASVMDVASTALVMVPPHPHAARPLVPAPGYGGDEPGDMGTPRRPAADRTHAGPAVAVEDAPSLVPSLAQDRIPPDFAEHAAGPHIETLAARRARAADGARSRRPGAWRTPGLPAIILILVAVVAALVNWRTIVVRYLPQTGSLFSAIGLPVNVRGLSFDNVKTSVETREGVSVLAVEGTIVNVARQAVEVPRLRFAVRNGAGYEVYAWTAVPTQAVLAPGDAAPFRTRLASPPADGEQVIVRFFNRRDAVSDVR